MGVYRKLTRAGAGDRGGKREAGSGMREAGAAARAGHVRFALRSRLGLGSDSVQQLAVACSPALQVIELKSLQWADVSGRGP